MSSSGNSNSERWEELQITQLLFGLTLDEQAEFDRLSETLPVEQKASFEQVVASLDLTWSDHQSMPLPDHLRKAIRTRAIEELNTPAIHPAGPTAAAAVTRPNASTKLPWLVAAACMAITAMTLFTAIPITPKKEISLSLSEQRSKLIASTQDLVQAKWGEGFHPIKNAEGDVVWSPSHQQGFMRFTGLPVNDPTKAQYQLWIFDRNQSAETPIDGGVFDISSDQEAVVPIQAKLRVQEAYQFAVTIEKPGGVVVSSRSNLPLLAAVK